MANSRGSLADGSLAGGSPAEGEGLAACEGIAPRKGLADSGIPAGGLRPAKGLLPAGDCKGRTMAGGDGGSASSGDMAYHMVFNPVCP
ncbi:hypothetical protein HF673_14960 [Acidithiobacillus thiooxidans]|uniref:Uncharacterized protein n=3 Tax=Acidithiobacillus TaxID=119977 RepID=A0A1C2HWM7_ACITH|nr:MULTISPECIES: hypothetical protein [Acidithiobacillus]MBU2742273.1 hypothetical protein [Acidithiobacillus albertensis]MBU2758843.1 hypothetical protein [Acidithiobacillus sulfurivorans]MBU2837027.1 hypothetical protein [Acidithiobacillus thiooxidans]OCX68131.1 hypothetical protein A6M23_18990 [Acidithiobacillus thiooxidans]OCX82181.1 hypothetical protein A6P08_12600 [Acidithiobacillus thiooxidans]